MQLGGSPGKASWAHVLLGGCQAVFGVCSGQGWAELLDLSIQEKASDSGGVANRGDAQIMEISSLSILRIPAPCLETDFET